MTTISVVMPVYNAAATLGETMESILGQSESDFELIVVDDGSTDATPRMLADYAARDARIMVLTQENRGLTYALMTGCSAARGDYIARHDAGDLSHPERLERQARELDGHRDLAFVSCFTAFAGPELEPLWITRGSGAASTPTSILDLSRKHGVIDGPTHHGSTMFRRDMYERAGGYRAAFYFGQDWDLWYRLAALGTYLTIPAVLYTARITASAISSAHRREQHVLAALSHAALLARDEGRDEQSILARAVQIRPRRRRAFCHLARGLYFIGEALRRNHDPRARRYLIQAIRSCPLLVRAWLRYAQVLLMSRR